MIDVHWGERRCLGSAQALRVDDNPNLSNDHRATPFELDMPPQRPPPRRDRLWQAGQNITRHDQVDKT